MKLHIFNLVFAILVLSYLLNGWSDRTSACKLGNVIERDGQHFVCVAQYVPCVTGQLARLAEHQRSEVRGMKESEIDTVCPTQK
jgi:hypothetical protein